MGGFGSGTWDRYDKKPTVEECLTIEMRRFRGRLIPHQTGTLGWRTANGHECSVRYLVSWNEVYFITLLYRHDNREDVRLAIELQSTPTRFGKNRMWFTCPLIVNGVACNRRVGKLYAPPRAKYFGCRHCHGLTYRSCQESHQSERMMNPGFAERMLATMQRWEREK